MTARCPYCPATFAPPDSRDPIFTIRVHLDTVHHVKQLPPVLSWQAWKARPR